MKGSVIMQHMKLFKTPTTCPLRVIWQGGGGWFSCCVSLYVSLLYMFQLGPRQGGPKTYTNKSQCNQNVQSALYSSNWPFLFWFWKKWTFKEAKVRTQLNGKKVSGVFQWEFWQVFGGLKVPLGLPMPKSKFREHFYIHIRSKVHQKKITKSWL